MNILDTDVTPEDIKKQSNYRKRCINAKGKACHICNSTKRIDVHHIDGDRYNNELDNLIPVCKECHNKIHTHSSESLSKWTRNIKPHKERKVSVTSKQMGTQMKNKTKDNNTNDGVGWTNLPWEGDDD